MNHPIFKHIPKLNFDTFFGDKEPGNYEPFYFLMTALAIDPLEISTSEMDFRDSIARVRLADATPHSFNDFAREGRGRRQQLIETIAAFFEHNSRMELSTVYAWDSRFGVWIAMAIARFCGQYVTSPYWKRALPEVFERCDRYVRENRPRVDEARELYHRLFDAATLDSSASRPKKAEEDAVLCALHALGMVVNDQSLFDPQDVYFYGASAIRRDPKIDPKKSYEESDRVVRRIAEEACFTYPL